MANENVNVQDDKLKKLLESDWIKSQEISNFDDFKNYSKDELLQMKKDSVTDKTITDGEKYRVRRNIDNILEARDKEEESLQSQKDEEERQEKQKEIDKEKQEEKEKQDEKVEDLKKQLESSEETSQDSVQEEVQEISQESTPEQGKSSAKQEENKEWETPAEENKEGENKEWEIPAEENKEEENKEWETKEKWENYQEQIDSLKKSNEELRKKINNQTEVINALLAMRAKRNAEAIKRLKEELKKSKEEIAKVKQERDNIINDNKKMKDLYFWKLPKYNGNIVPLKTKAIEFRFWQDDIIWNQRVLSMPQLRLRKNIISRYRLNATIKKLNEIWDNPKAWVNYVLTKADFFRWWAKIWTLCKKIWNYFKIRDIASFDQKYNEQKKIFIDDIEAKMQWQMSDDDKKTIKAIKDRLDYYQKAYKRQFLTV